MDNTAMNVLPQSAGGFRTVGTTDYLQRAVCFIGTGDKVRQGLEGGWQGH